MTNNHPIAQAAYIVRTTGQINPPAKKFGIDPNELRRIRGLQQKREAARRVNDPLIIRAERRARAAQWKREEARAARRELEAAAARDSLLAAARIARSLGFKVRSSKSRSGHISSYYCQHADGRRLRISDHEIPWTPQRDMVASMHGHVGYCGYHGDELIIDCARSKTWLRRAIILTAAGRSVP